MRTYIYRLIALLIITTTFSCDSYLINGDLDGFWQVKSIENKQTGEMTVCNGDIYYSFQQELVLVSYVSPTIPTGQMKENYIAYFTHENDSITMTDFRLYLDKDATQATLPELAKFGLYETYNRFQVEKLDSRSLILNSEKSRIVLRKH